MGAKPYLCHTCIHQFAKVPNLEAITILPDDDLLIKVQWTGLEYNVNGILLDFLGLDAGEKNDEDDPEIDAPNVFGHDKDEHTLLKNDPNLCVYIAKMNQSACIKIGITTNLDTRRAQLQTSNPQEIMILRTIITPQARLLEKHLHERFAAYRQQGEWFALPSALLGDLLLEEFDPMYASYTQEPPHT